MNWKETYDRESPALYSFLLARGCAPDLAEDLIQEVFLAAMSAGTQIERPRAYLFQAARNGLARVGRPAPTLEDVANLVDPSSAGQSSKEKAGDGEAINQAMARLPMEQREVVVLRVWHEMSFREISEALALSQDTVASRWRYGIAKLKSLLKEKEDRDG